MQRRPLEGVLEAEFENESLEDRIRAKLRELYPNLSQRELRILTDNVEGVYSEIIVLPEYRNLEESEVIRLAINRYQRERRRERAGRVPQFDIAENVSEYARGLREINTLISQSVDFLLGPDEPEEAEELNEELITNAINAIQQDIIDADQRLREVRGENFRRLREKYFDSDIVRNDKIFDNDMRLVYTDDFTRTILEKTNRLENESLDRELIDSLKKIFSEFVYLKSPNYAHHQIYPWYTIYRFFGAIRHKTSAYPELKLIEESFSRQEFVNWKNLIRRMILNSHEDDIRNLIRYVVPNEMKDSYLDYVSGNQNLVYNTWEDLLETLDIEVASFLINLIAGKCKPDSDTTDVKFRETREILITVRDYMIIESNIVSHMERNQWDTQEIINIWTLFFALISLCRKVMRTSISLSSFVLEQEQYGYSRHTGVIGEQRVLQAFPFMVVSKEGGGQDFENFLKFIRQTVRQIRDKPVVDLVLKFRIKKIIRQDGNDLQNDELYFTIPIDLIQKLILAIRNKFVPEDDKIPVDARGWYADIYESQLRGVDDINLSVEPENVQTYIKQQAREYRKNFFDSIVNSPDSSLIEVLKGWLGDALLDKSAEYTASFIRTEDNELDWHYILIDQIEFFIKEGAGVRSVLVQRVLPVFCSSLKNGVYKSLAKYTEVLDAGLCLYESLWTSENAENIINKEIVNIDGVETKMWTLNGRRKKMMYDFHHEEEKLQVACISGDFNTWRGYIRESARFSDIEVAMWDENDIDRDFNVRDDKKYIVVFDGHAIYADNGKLKKKVIELPATKLSSENAKGGWRSFKRSPVIAANDNREDYCLDIETYWDPVTGIMKPYLICVVHEDPSKCKTWYGYDDCVEKFNEWMKQMVSKDNLQIGHHKKDGEKVCIWTYNGCKFDLIYLIRGLINLPGFELKGSLKNIKTLNIGKQIIFLDLLKICPFGSLEKQCQFWGLEMKKHNIDHDKITRDYLDDLWTNKENIVEGVSTGEEIIEEIIAYCIQDCKMLLNCVKKYKEFIYDTFEVSPYVHSTASLSFNYYYTHHCLDKPIDKNSKNFNFPSIRGVPKSIYPDVKSSYKGGICQVFRKKPTVDEKELYYYDINSSYPAAMLHPKIPAVFNNTVYTPGKAFPESLRVWEIEDERLYKVVGMKWKDNTLYPTIPSRSVNGLTYERQCNEVEFIWGIELKFAVETGNVETFSSPYYHSFTTKPLFKKFVEAMYALRQDFKSKGNLIGDTFCKLILNSKYGKYGQQIFPNAIYCNPLQVIYYANLHSDSHMIKDIESVGDRLYKITYHKYEYAHQVGSCVHIASYITARARVNWFNGVKDVTSNLTKNTLFYGDTDSITCSVKMSDALVDNARLGAWKLEYTLSKGIFIAPKIYWLQDVNGKEIKRFKGLNCKDIPAEKFEELLEKGTLDLVGGVVFIRKKDYVMRKSNLKKISLKDKRVFNLDFTFSLPK